MVDNGLKPSYPKLEKDNESPVCEAIFYLFSGVFVIYGMGYSVLPLYLFKSCSARLQLDYTILGSIGVTLMASL